MNLDADPCALSILKIILKKLIEYKRCEYKSDMTEGTKS